MPVYEYHCEKCDKSVEMIRPMRDADAPVKCEGCGQSRSMKRLHSTFATTTGGGGSQASPAPGCGRCGDPRGSCSM
ncbi:MAG: zinc ribbon domain-containing protein [Planctomycetes bacterium]|nr:zinc ribbon domain-containing protein [Planctomycetota bacterium]